MDPVVVKNIRIGEYSEVNGWLKRKNLQEMGDDIYQGNIKTHTCFSKYLSVGKIVMFLVSSKILSFRLDGRIDTKIIEQEIFALFQSMVS